ncbi:hypothetical protein NKG94_12975 [Micromonospora sp. M12]
MWQTPQDWIRTTASPGPGSGTTMVVTSTGAPLLREMTPRTSWLTSPPAGGVRQGRKPGGRVCHGLGGGPRANLPRPPRPAQPARRVIAGGPGYAGRIRPRPPGVTMKLAHLPLRVSIGAYFLNSGLGKRTLEGAAAEGIHGMAVAAMPQLGQFEPARFAKLLAYSEIALGPRCSRRSSRRPWSGSV